MQFPRLFRFFRRFARGLLPWLLAFAWAGSLRAAEATVWIALSETEGAYVEAAEAVRRRIDADGTGRFEIQVLPWRAFLGGGRPEPKLVVAVGAAAFAGFAESEVRAPLLATLLPQSAYERQTSRAAQTGRAQSAVFLDQPLARQLELLRLAFPDRRRVGMILGPEAGGLLPALRKLTAARGLSLVAAEIGDVRELAQALQKTLAEADILLAQPDPLVYNGLTVQNILTAAYRQRIPVAGFSPAYVKAGALIALYSTPAQVGEQAGEVARAVLSGRPLPLPQPPRDFSIGINPAVARSLGLGLDAAGAEALAERLRMQEKKP